MTTLVIPDIHNHIDSADSWIECFPSDRVLFLGDYFDSFGDDPETAGRTAEWLRGSLEKSNRIHLWGNHDLSYAFPGRRDFFCPGFTPEKSEVVSQILNWDEHWRKLKLVHFEDEVAFSHAGISSVVFGRGVSRETVEERCREGMRDAVAGKEPLDPVFSVMGIVWQRWQVMGVRPEFSQVVGHTPMREVGIDIAFGRFNVCLDTFGQYVGWLEDGAFRIIDTETGETIDVSAQAAGD